MGNVPACLNYPKLPGTSPDLSKVDSKVMNIISHFKEVTGTDMFTLTGSQFLVLIMNLMSAAPIFIGSVVPPTQDEFNSKMFSLKAGPDVGQDSTINDIVYIYYFGKATNSIPSVSSVTSGGQSWWDSLFSPATTPTTSSAPDPSTVASLMASIQPAAGTATTPATAVGGATTQPVTAASPVPGWKSYASNLANQATNTATDALVAQGNANAGIPATPVVPPVA